ncbi:aminotransferase class I/II-fold pyridoxal phosphate-dependent enzyme [Nocardia farcinica]|uniref:aminotransferase class I/II-fold pyridoxal phosphate-dependent enzyme n=1 Tax=Nocardia farcinica TaxID=37329 RepID=UPI002454D658|nr:aminotransferase class I/II-fold pyridoxal phosphate-dependent enzyme [Nocardia farcinica]
MDQPPLLWWTTVVFRRGADGAPRYRGIADDLERAVEAGVVGPGRRLPAERTLAAGLCVSRGTVVRAFEELVARGVVERVHGSGTFVRARRTRPPRPAGPATVESAVDDPIELSHPVPADATHLPPVDWSVHPADFGAGMPTGGLPELRDALSRFLTHRMNLPTRPEQVVVTTDADAALDALLRAHRGRPIVAGPAWPALHAVIAGQDSARVPLTVDAAGIDPTLLRRVLRRTGSPVVVLDPTESGPCGLPTAVSRLPRLAAALTDGAAVTVEDVSALPVEVAADPDRPPLAALSERVIALGDLGRLFWAGAGIGWLRTTGAAPASPLPRPAIGAQLHAARLLDAIDADWLRARREVLADRATHLHRRLTAVLPSWVPATTLDGVRAALPVLDAATFVHVAARFGVRVRPGHEGTADASVRDQLWLSATHPPETLDLAVDRLAAAWAEYTRRMAASV